MFPPPGMLLLCFGLRPPCLVETTTSFCTMDAGGPPPNAARKRHQSCVLKYLLLHCTPTPTHSLHSLLSSPFLPLAKNALALLRHWHPRPPPPPRPPPAGCSTASCAPPSPRPWRCASSAVETRRHTHHRFVRSFVHFTNHARRTMHMPPPIHEFTHRSAFLPVMPTIRSTRPPSRPPMASGSTIPVVA